MDIAQSTKIIKSMADLSRLRVLHALTEKACYVQELAERLELAASTVSFHLKKLEEAGLVSSTKEQYYTIYQLNKAVCRLTLLDLICSEDIEQFMQQQRLDEYREKVIRTFIRQNKLVQLPVQHKKRLIILDEFLSRFKSGREYPEQEVNEIIGSMYDDYCTIRRLLIEEGMMRRKNQIYSVIENGRK